MKVFPNTTFSARLLVSNIVDDRGMVYTRECIEKIYNDYKNSPASLYDTGKHTSMVGHKPAFIVSEMRCITTEQFHLALEIVGECLNTQRGMELKQILEYERDKDPGTFTTCVYGSATVEKMFWVHPGIAWPGGSTIITHFEISRISVIPRRLSSCD